ncbi:aminopeptidase P family N-terminal domain-containing protein [Candidatus Bathyarchaeota archaeon]|nr:aminopeptidase P family N-terminal domain-containing protein [Candidatus Bathyarchaeota archaeon]
MTGVKLADFDLPEFGMPKKEPRIGGETYQTRLEKLYEKADKEGLNALVVYGDREHAANLAYLTGYDPRFEESMLVLDVATRKASLVMGHEGLGYFPVSPVKESLTPVLYQSFSLMAQPRDGTRPVEDILGEAGIEAGGRVGVLGWKYFTEQETQSPEHRLEAPSYIVDALRTLVGHLNVVNANALLMHPTEGLRALNEVDQLAWFEYASCHTSQAVSDVVFNIEPGMTEHDAVRLMKLNGIPLSCHLMLSSGPRAFMGLPSPSSREIEQGDPFTTAYGAWGALTCRAGWVVDDETQLHAEVRDYVPKLVAPYFEAVADWYRLVGVGVEGGALYKAVHDRIGDPFYGVNLNPGHLIHLDEWLNSPISRGSLQRLRSGMALQVDVIPATGTPYFTSNMEDGIALADAKLRADFAAAYPGAWDRIQARRDFMADSLGIRLKPEVLPFSNLAAYLPPFLLSPWKAMRLSP